MATRIQREFIIGNSSLYRDDDVCLKPERAVLFDPACFKPNPNPAGCLHPNFKARPVDPASSNAVFDSSDSFLSIVTSLSNQSTTAHIHIVCHLHVIKDILPVNFNETSVAT